MFICGQSMSGAEALGGELGNVILFPHFNLGEKITYPDCTILERQ